MVVKDSLLKYTDEEIISPSGESCKVIDMTSDLSVVWVSAIKKHFPLVFKANGGEIIIARHLDGTIESTCTAEENDAVFMSPVNIMDLYIPKKPDGSRMKFHEIKNYFKVSRVCGYDHIVIAKDLYTHAVAFNMINQPSCIKNAFGENRHQFLYEGAVLKRTKDGFTGIEKETFYKTWDAADFI